MSVTTKRKLTLRSYLPVMYVMCDFIESLLCTLYYALPDVNQPEITKTFNMK